MKDALYDVIFKIKEFLFFIWSHFEGVYNSHLPNENSKELVGEHDRIVGFYDAISSPFDVINYVLYEQPNSLFYYFLTNSFTLILWGFFLYFAYGFIFTKHPIITKAFLLAVMFGFKFIGTSIVFSGGVIAMSGYFYPAFITQYLVWAVVFTFCLPQVILMLPFTYFLGLKYSFNNFASGIYKQIKSATAVAANTFNIGIDIRKYTGDSQGKLSDGF